MHPRFKKIANRFPQFRHLLAETNQAIREGKLTMSIRQWLELSPKLGINVYEFSRMTGQMIDDGLVCHHIEIRDLLTDEVVARPQSFSELEPVYDGKTVLIRKDIDFTEFDGDPAHFVYMESMYIFTDLYGVSLSNTA